MLVLSRQKDESIMIGDDVKITVVDVRGDKVRLGITAPKEIPVHRIEIYEAIQREKKEKQTQEQLAEAAREQPAEAAQQQPKKEPRKQVKKKLEKQPEEQPEEQRQH